MTTEQTITQPSDENRTLKFLPTNPFKHVKLLIVVILHWAVVIGNFSAFFILAFQGFTPFGLPWYVCLPLCSFIALISFSRVLDCPMTRYENKSPKNLEFWGPISTKKELINLYYTSLRNSIYFAHVIIKTVHNDLIH